MIISLLGEALRTEGISICAISQSSITDRIKRHWLATFAAGILPVWAMRKIDFCDTWRYSATSSNVMTSFMAKNGSIASDPLETRHCAAMSRFVHYSPFLTGVKQKISGFSTDTLPAV